jgi:hypothetical protein
MFDLSARVENIIEAKFGQSHDSHMYITMQEFSKIRKGLGAEAHSSSELKFAVLKINYRSAETPTFAIEREINLFPQILFTDISDVKFCEFMHSNFVFWSRRSGEIFNKKYSNYSMQDEIYFRTGGGIHNLTSITDIECVPNSNVF